MKRLLVERALGLLFELEDASALNNYWLSVESMREDWDEMPEDWFVAEVSNSFNDADLTRQPRSFLAFAGQGDSRVRA